MPKSRRNSAIDMLKVASIFFIILHHYALWSGWHFGAGFSPAKLAAQTLLIGGKLGVDLFVMITGYFLIRSSAKVKSLVTIWVETTLIALVVYIVLCIWRIGGTHLSVVGVIWNLFPVLFGRYWFVTSYTLLYIFVPFLNRLFLSLTARGRIRLLGTMFVLFSLVPFVYYEKGMTFSFPVWFIFLYLIGAELRLHEVDVKQLKLRSLVLGLGTTLIVSVIANVGLQITLGRHGRVTALLHFLGWGETVFYTRDASPLMLILAVLIFASVMRVHLDTRPFLQYISRGAFGVYLLQSAPVFSTEYLWPNLVNGSRFHTGLAIIGYGFLVAFLIYIVGLLVYFLLFPFRQLFMRGLSRPISWVQQKLDLSITDKSKAGTNTIGE